MDTGWHLLRARDPEHGKRGPRGTGLPVPRGAVGLCVASLHHPRARRVWRGGEGGPWPQQEEDGGGGGLTKMSLAKAYVEGARGADPETGLLPVPLTRGIGVHTPSPGGGGGGGGGAPQLIHQNSDAGCLGLT